VHLTGGVAFSRQREKGVSLLYTCESRFLSFSLREREQPVRCYLVSKKKVARNERPKPEGAAVRGKKPDEGFR
jgi:hypothetical protein